MIQNGEIMNKLLSERRYISRSVNKRITILKIIKATTSKWSRWCLAWIMLGWGFVALNWHLSVNQSLRWNVTLYCGSFQSSCGLSLLQTLMIFPVYTATSCVVSGWNWGNIWGASSKERHLLVWQKKKKT